MHAQFLFIMISTLILSITTSNLFSTSAWEVEMDGSWVRPWVGSLCHYGDESQSLIEKYLSYYPHYQEPNQTVIVPDTIQPEFN